MEETTPGSKARGRRVLRAIRGVLSEYRLSIIIGAGVSASAGIPLWRDLVFQTAANAKVPMVASFHGQEPARAARIVRDKLDDTSFHKALHRALYQGVSDTSPYIETVADLIMSGRVIRTITSNYDDLVERALLRRGATVRSVTDGRTSVVPNCATIAHIHGLLPKEKPLVQGDLIFTEDDYHRLYSTGFNWPTFELLSTLTHSSCLFLGHSLADDDIRRVIDLSRGLAVPLPHYALMVTPGKKPDEAVDQVVGGMGIASIWIDDPSYASEVLQVALQFSSRA